MDLGLVRIARVVERGPTLQPERHRPSHHLHTTDECPGPRTAVRGSHGHEVNNLPDPVGGEEPRHEDVGVRPVKLLVRHPVLGGSNLEPPSLVMVEDSGEHAGGIKVGQAQPIDRPIRPHQGGRAHIADEAMIFDGLIRHRLTPTPRSHRIIPPRLEIVTKFYCPPWRGRTSPA